MTYETMEDLRDEIAGLKDVIAEMAGHCEAPLPGLTKSESRLVRALENAGGRTLTHDALMNAMYFDHSGEDPEINIVPVFICKIRKKDPSLRARLLNVWGIGYRLKPEAGDG